MGGGEAIGVGLLLEGLGEFGTGGEGGLSDIGWWGGGGLGDLGWRGGGDVPAGCGGWGGEDLKAGEGVGTIDASRRPPVTDVAASAALAALFLLLLCELKPN